MMSPLEFQIEVYRARLDLYRHEIVKYAAKIDPDVSFVPISRGEQIKRATEYVLAQQALRKNKVTPLA